MALGSIRILLVAAAVVAAVALTYRAGKRSERGFTVAAQAQVQTEKIRTKAVLARAEAGEAIARQNADAAAAARAETVRLAEAVTAAEAAAAADRARYEKAMAAASRGEDAPLAPVLRDVLEVLRGDSRVPAKGAKR